MSDLSLVKSANFGHIRCDFWKNQKSEIFMTRWQIGTALEYKNPNDAIRNIHARYRDRLDKFSVALKLSGTDGKLYDTFIYSTKGIYEICRWSRQPRADAFMDWVWDVIEGIRTGELELSSKENVRRIEAEARLINARTRQSRILLDALKASRNTAPESLINKLVCSIIEVSSGKPVLNNTEIELKLRDLIDYKLKAMEQEWGQLTDTLIENMLMEYRKEFDAGSMLPEVYRAFAAELHRRLNTLN